MKTLYMLLNAGAVIALIGLVNVATINVATADIRNDSLQQGLTFVIDAGDGSVSMPNVSFDSIGSDGTESALGTCEMTPGGEVPNLLLEEQLMPQTRPQLTARTPDVDLAPISALRTPPASGGGSGRRYPPEGTPTIPEIPEIPVIVIPIVPEPATLFVVGLGLGAAAFASRRRRNVH